MMLYKKTIIPLTFIVIKQIKNYLMNKYLTSYLFRNGIAFLLGGGTLVRTFLAAFGGWLLVFCNAPSGWGFGGVLLLGDLLN